MSGSNEASMTSTWNMDAMANPGVARFRKQLDAETWANRLSLDSIRTVPASAAGTEEYRRMLQLLPHNQLARSVWLSRLKGEVSAPPTDWFPVWTLEATAAACEQNDLNWSAYLESLKDSSLSKPIIYRSSEGQGYQSLVEDVIMHVFNHSTYHRGQLARLVTQCGGKRASTDLIGYTRLKL